MERIDRNNEQPTLTKGLRDGLMEPQLEDDEGRMVCGDQDSLDASIKASKGKAKPNGYVHIPTLDDGDGVAPLNIRARFARKILNRYRFLKTYLPEPRPTVEDLYIEALDVGGEEAWKRRGLTMPEYLK